MMFGVGTAMNFFIYFKIMFFIHLNQSWSIQTNIFETNIINLALIFLFFFSIVCKSQILYKKRQSKLTHGSNSSNPKFEIYI